MESEIRRHGVVIEPFLDAPLKPGGPGHSALLQSEGAVRKHVRHGRGNPDFEAQTDDRPLERLWHDSYNGEAALIQKNLAADDARVGSEFRLPKTMAEHGYRMAAGVLVLVLEKRSAEFTLHVQHLEVIR